MELWQISLPARSSTNNIQLRNEPELIHQMTLATVATLPLFSTDNKEHTRPCISLSSVSQPFLILLFVDPSYPFVIIPARSGPQQCEILGVPNSHEDPQTAESPVL